jgi:photosystem II stability/assembly factor-like uncharacterized protein
MSSGKHGIKERISYIAKKPKMIMIMLMLVIIIIAASVGCAFTGGILKPDTDNGLPPTLTPTLAPSITPTPVITDVPATGPIKESTETLIPTITSSVGKADGEYYNDLYSLDFVDDKSGWVVQWSYIEPYVNSSTILYHTNDGGANWESYESKGCLLQKVSFLNNEIGWAIAIKGHQNLYEVSELTYQILWTKDSGKTWREQMNCSTYNDQMNDFYGKSYDIKVFGKDRVCVIIGGTIYCTEDGGKNWFKVKNPVKNFIAKHVEFADEKNGWISGVVQSSADSLDTVYVINTSDSGKTWKQQFSEKIDGLNIIDISFADKNNGWLQINDYGSFTGELFHTTDGGSNWSRVGGGSGARPYPMELEAVTPKILWISLNSGAGPVDGGLSYSEDGGKNFSFINEEYGTNGVEFVTPALGWAVKDGYQEKYLIKTLDGGKTWDDIKLP